MRRWKLWLVSLKSWYSYSPQNLPGLLQSPAGSLLHRISILLLAAELTGKALVDWKSSPLPQLFAMGAKHYTAVTAQLNAADVGPIERMKHRAVTWFTTFAVMAAIPVLLPIVLAAGMVTPVLCEAAAAAEKSRDGNATQSIIADIRSSQILSSATVFTWDG